MSKKKLKFTVTIDHKDGNHVESARQWCEDNLGPRWVATGFDGIWAVFWAGPRSELRRGYIWHFHNEQDALLFKLIWG
jgi:hypothetical protein